MLADMSSRLITPRRRLTLPRTLHQARAETLKELWRAIEDYTTDRPAAGAGSDAKPVVETEAEAEPGWKEFELLYGCVAVFLVVAWAGRSASADSSPSEDEGSTPVPIVQGRSHSCCSAG